MRRTKSTGRWKMGGGQVWSPPHFHWFAAVAAILVLVGACRKRGQGDGATKERRGSVCTRPRLVWSAPGPEGKTVYHGLELVPTGHEEQVIGTVANLVASWGKACGSLPKRATVQLDVNGGRVAGARLMGSKNSCIEEQARTSQVPWKGAPARYTLCVFLGLPKPPGRK